ncbi:uncharacterized protein N7506_011194 [Penicillium brevicompactum]|uniref:uncharacterized protein n=1 Tax=Penicillium brevicompactum TaxID=5074 RepID=UPI0025423787|nr:uncharacterized protein N7506_011194 [Penicillium brevicompactum]KAJ5322064.1 hypothetical protein N7506_011194 [Penicillium brevicompactum]
MRLSTLAQVLFTTTTLALDASLGSTLNVTVLGARHNRSTLECWALKPGFETSSEAGTSGSSVLDLGSVTGNATFTTLPAGFDGEARVEGGKNGAILALDTADVSALGHYTTYPSKERTVALEIPLGEAGAP